MGLGGGDAGGVQWEMLVIGPVTTVGEMMMGGHWFEMLKVQRQAGTYPSYFAAAKHMWGELGFAGFYKGFWPWGFAQGCYKGLPVLFTQGEVNRRLQEQGVPKQTASIAAGVTAGMVQGAMIAPTQRLKTIIGTNKSAGAVSTDLITHVIKTEGFMTVFKGTGVMVVRRGVDWGLRFYGKGLSDQFFLAQKGPGQPKKLTATESFMSGIFGGAFSGINQPLDVWVANCQKHRSVPLGASAVLAELVAESRVKGFFAVFFRGIEMRILHSSYHTAWMAGLGQYIFDTYTAYKLAAPKH
jgi:hypothetical protein